VPAGDGATVRNSGRFAFADLESLLRPQSIAIIGASRDAAKVAGKPLRILRLHGFSGQIYPVNPKYTEIDGVPCLQSVKDLPSAVDVALIVVPIHECIRAVASCAERRVRNVIVFTGGFAEVGDEGQRLQEQLVAAARSGGTRVFGPNSMGYMNLRDHVVATFAGPLMEIQTIPPGRISFISQSGAMGTLVHSWATVAGLSLNHFISVGNEADLDMADFVAHLAGDDTTLAIGLHIEGARDGRRLMAAADLAVAAQKPICILKTGRTRSGSRAAYSHTGALAGEEAVYSGMVDQLGLCRVGEPVEIADLLGIFDSGQPLPTGCRFGLITTSGGMGVWLADSIEAAGAEVAKLSASTRRRLSAILPSYASTLNPVDLTGQIVNDPSILASCVQAVAADRGVDIVLALAANQPTTGEAIAHQVVAAGTKKPLVVVWLFGPAGVYKTLQDARIPVFSDPGRAVRAAVRFVNWATRAADVRRNRAEVAQSSSRRVLPSVRGRRTEHEAKLLLRQLGIAVPEGALARSREEAVDIAGRLRPPVVLKGQSRLLPHKAQAGVVALNLRSKRSVELAYDRILSKGALLRSSWRGVLVERMIPVALEFMVGATRDPVFGPVVAFAIGGTTVEALKRVTFRVAPLTLDDAQRMLREVGALQMLKGDRAEKAAARVEEILVELSCIAAENPWLLTLEINPLAVDPHGNVIALDALLEGC
jgi:acyl-CoA synthetase (NDP forming)